jgi:hypothetical protein
MAAAKYDPAMPQTAFKLALLGLVDAEIADVLGVSERTLHRFKRQHPEFAEALTLGKGPANAAVAASLYQRAIGYTDPAGKHYPPDVVAQIFWLKNRRPHQWRDRVELDQTHRIEPADMEALQRAHEEALAHAERQRADLLGRADRLGLTFENEAGAWSETDEPLPIGDDDMTEENP